MPATYFSVVTLLGQAKIAAAIAGTGTVTIAEIAAGDGNGNFVTPVVTQTALVHEIYRGDVESVARDPLHPTQVIVRATIPGSAGPATVRELGLFADDGQLVAVSNYPSTEIAAAGEGAVTDIVVEFVFVVDTAAPVTIQINPAGLVYLAGMRRPPFIGIDEFAASPPATPADDTLVVVSAAPTGAFAGLAHQLAQWNGSVWLSCPAPWGTIVANADDGKYYQRTETGWVEMLWGNFITTHITKTVGPDGDFATLADAFAWLSFYVITSTGYVTLSLAGGQHAMNASLYIKYPWAHRVTITGAALTGAAPVVGDFAMTGNTLAARNADRTSNLAMLRAKYATELVLTGAAIEIESCSLALLDKVLVTGNGNGANSILLHLTNASVNFGDVAVVGTGASALGSLVDAQHRSSLVVGGTMSIVGGTGGGINIVDSTWYSAGSLFAFGNAGSNVWMGSRGYLGKAHCRGNGGNGFDVSSSLLANASSNACSGNSNGNAGAYVYNGGRVTFGNASEFKTNATYGLYAAFEGWFSAYGVVATGNLGTADVRGYYQGRGYIGTGYTIGMLSPAVNTDGNRNSQIVAI